MNDECFNTAACNFCVLSLQLVDYRVEFSKWWVTEFKSVKFPAQGTVFDYYIDPESKKFEPWSKIVPNFEMDPDVPLQVCIDAFALFVFIVSLNSDRRLTTLQNQTDDLQKNKAKPA